MKRQKGFTLIELMVVVIILGILIAVVAPRVPALIRRAREGATKGALASLRSAVTIYYSDNEGFYPNPANDSDGSGNRFRDVMVPKYLSSLPTCNTAIHPPSTACVVDTAVPTNWEGSPAGCWFYNSPGSWTSAPAADDGEVKVKCSCTDSTGKAWNTY